jgi:hypothetical protein
MSAKLSPKLLAELAAHREQKARSEARREQQKGKTLARAEARRDNAPAAVLKYTSGGTKYEWMAFMRACRAARRRAQ